MFKYTHPLATLTALATLATLAVSLSLRPRREPMGVLRTLEGLPALLLWGELKGTKELRGRKEGRETAVNINSP